MPTGVQGLYGRSAVFEAVGDGLNGAITALGADQLAEVLRFRRPWASAISRPASTCRASRSSPAPSTASAATSAATAASLARLQDGEDWTDQQQPSGVVLTPAACYPIYPVMARRGPLPEAGKVVDVLSYCFRHEPSLEPTRMQLFRQREYVCLGSPERIVAFRQLWMERGQQLARALQLPLEVDVANDPFFGRGGKIVADSQREQKLKFELLIPVNDGAPPTACMSFITTWTISARCGISARPMAAWPTPAAWASASSGWCWPCCATMASTPRAGRQACAPRSGVPDVRRRERQGRRRRVAARRQPGGSHATGTSTCGSNCCTVGNWSPLPPCPSR